MVPDGTMDGKSYFRVFRTRWMGRSGYIILLVQRGIWFTFVVINILTATQKSLSERGSYLLSSINLLYRVELPDGPHLPLILLVLVTIITRVLRQVFTSNG